MQNIENVYRAWAEVDLEAICQNVKNLKQNVRPSAKAMAVVKADAYGHGAVEVARALDGLVDAYGVAVVEEGVMLRENGLTKPILILGYTPPECFCDVVRHDLSQTVYQYRTAALLDEEAGRQGKLARLHVKVDTGMGRLGFFPDGGAVEDIVRMAGLKRCRLEGCYSHFARADEADLSFSKNQWKRFCEFTHILKGRGVRFSIRHMGNSAAAMQMPEAAMDMVRYGISMYGMYPSEQVEAGRVSLTPAMALRARIAYVKEVDKGTPIGYGGTYVADKRTKVATIPLGYADGYPWALSGKGRVLHRGESAPIVGRVCMDQFMVDATRLKDAKEGEVVTLLGRDGNDEVTAQEWGRLAQSFHYEVVCGVGKRIPRVYRGGA